MIYKIVEFAPVLQRVVMRMALTVVVTTSTAGSIAQGASGGVLKLVVRDAQTRTPLAARIHLKNARGRAVRVRGNGILSYADHIIIDGGAELKLRKGQYTFSLDVGPEYKPRSGHFEIDDHADDEKIVEMHRFVDLGKEYWWAGDSLVVRLFRHADQLLRAEDLRVLPLAVTPRRRGRGSTASGGYASPRQIGPQRIAGLQSIYVEDAHGALVLHNVPSDRVPTPKSIEADTTAAMDFAIEQGIHAEVALAASWDLPLWLIDDQVDSIQLIDRTAMENDVRPLPAGCRKPDRSFFPGKSGQGRWSERIYYHILNCGFRLPPSAGSGSGLTPNPPGRNRVYVHCDELTYDQWWTNLRAGQVFVTNGPLLRPRVQGRPPGHVFHIDKHQKARLQIGLDLATRARIEYLEVIVNGEVSSQVRLSEWAESGGNLPVLEMAKSGWFLVRAATGTPNVYQFATSGPYYVEANYRPRISKRSVQFFLDWIEALETHDRRRRLLDDRRQGRIETARAYWTDVLKRATDP